MALQPERGLGPILNAIDIIVADTQQKRRALREDTIRREGFEREDRQRLQSGKIGALGKIFGIQGIDPAQKQKAFETIIDTIGNPETDVGGFDLSAQEEEDTFDLTPETEAIFPALEGFKPNLPELFKIQDQRTARQRANDAGELAKANIQRIRAGKSGKTKKDTTTKDFLDNLGDFKKTLTEETKRITKKDLLGNFAPAPGQEERFKELKTDVIPELEKLERTVSGFRATSIEELSRWFDRGWIEKDMLKELLIENGLLDEFNDILDQPQINQPRKPQPQKRKLQGF